MRDRTDDTRYVRRVVKSAAHGSRNIRIIGKERRYVDDYSEVPDGASLHEGEQGGLYYETEEVEAFAAEQEERTNKIIEEGEFSDEQVQKAREIHEAYAANGEDHFNTIMSIAEGTDANLVGAAYRTKGVGSILNKVHERDNEYESVEDLGDVFGGMIKPESPEGVIQAGDAIEEQFGDRVVKKEDYMEEPQGGYYRARQYVLEMDNGQKAEVQIKSPEMSEIASIGHTLVYKNDETPEDVPDVAEQEEEEVRDCLTQLMNVVVGEQAEEPSCSETATQHIQEVSDILGEFGVV